MPDGALALVKTVFNPFGPFKQVGNIEACQFGYVFPVDEKVEGFPVEAVAVAFGAHEAGVEFPAPFLSLGRCVVTLLHLDVFHQPVVAKEIIRYGMVFRFDLQSFRRAVEDVVYGFFGKVLDRHFEVAPVFFANRGNLPKYGRVLIFAKRDDGPVED